MKPRDREAEARRLADLMIRDYDRWRAEHPNATALAQLAEIYRRSNQVLREHGVQRGDS